MKREVLRDNIAKAIADAAGHGMREKCTRHADAVLDVLDSRQAARPQPAAPRVVSNERTDALHQLAFEIGETDEAGTGYNFSMEQFDEFARAAIESIAPVQQDPCAWINRDNLTELQRGGPRQPVFGKQHLDVDTPLYAAPQPAQPSVPVGMVKEFAKAMRVQIDDPPLSWRPEMEFLLETLEQLIAAHDGKGE